MDRIPRTSKRSSRAKATRVFVFALLILGGLGFVTWIRSNPWKQRQPDNPVANLAPTLNKPTQTITPIKTFPTMTSSPVFLPTNTPSLIPASQYLANPADVLPTLPTAYEQVWVLNDDSPAFKNSRPDNWQNETYTMDANKTENYQYTNTGSFELTYTLDQPVQANTSLEILVMDTPKWSNIDTHFEVLADGATVTPFFGTGDISFQNSIQQPDPSWLSIGIYTFSKGKIPQVKVKVDKVPAGSIFAADRVVIGQLRQNQMAILSTLPKEMPLSALWDDANAEKKVEVGQEFKLSKEGWKTTDSSQSWNGSFQYLPAGWRNTIQVTWGPPHSLQAGKYWLYARIPDKSASVTQAEYYLLVDGKTIDRTSPRWLNQSQTPGEWQPVLEYILTTPASIQVVLEIGVDIPGEIGVDAVALVRLP